MMGMVREADLHFWVVRGVARRMGVNVSEAMYDGRLSRAAFGAMVERCRGCGAADGCLRAMAEPVGSAPDCANARALAALRG